MPGQDAMKFLCAAFCRATAKHPVIFVSWRDTIFWLQMRFAAHDFSLSANKSATRKQDLWASAVDCRKNQVDGKVKSVRSSLRTWDSWSSWLAHSAHNTKWYSIWRVMALTTIWKTDNTSNIAMNRSERRCPAGHELAVSPTALKTISHNENTELRRLAAYDIYCSK